HSVIADSSLEWAAAGRSSLIPHWNRLPLCLFGISLEISHLRAPIRSLDRRILSGLNKRYFLPSGPSRSIQSLLLSSAISRISSMRLGSGRGSRTNSNTSRQIPARVIDAAYDTLPTAGFCADLRKRSVFGCPPRTLAKFGLGIDRRPTDNSPMNKLYYERADYSVVVKNRAPPPKAWRWEIYRAGNVNPIKQSSVYFDTTAAA